MEHAICSNCKETKSVEMFSRDKNRKSGLRKWCKVCCEAREKERGARNRARTTILIPDEGACTKCKETKSVEMFSRNKGAKSGLHGWCKSCWAATDKMRREKNQARTTILIPAEKACPSCGVTKSSEHFYQALGVVTGLAGFCKSCCARVARLRKYGLSHDDYSRMLKEQNHQCAICAVDFKDVTKGACVDHCHTTRKVRALLCGPCNVSIGLLKEDIAVLCAAINYLLCHNRAA